MLTTRIHFTPLRTAVKYSLRLSGFDNLPVAGQPRPVDSVLSSLDFPPYRGIVLQGTDMKSDFTMGHSFLFSCAVHAVAFLLFSFVIVLDLGTAAPSSMEMIYIGRTGEKEKVTDAVVLELSMEMAPFVNLPDRLFAVESVYSNMGEKLAPFAALAGKMTFARDYARGRLDEEIITLPKDVSGENPTVTLSVKKRYSVEGQLALRKIIIRPDVPEYPAWATKGSVEADVKLRVTVNPQGIVERVENVQSTGYPKMDLVASRYIKQWRFESRAFGTESETGIVLIKFRLK